MFAAIRKASPTNPPGLSSSNVSNFGSAANCAASPASIGPDACTVRWSGQVKVIASAMDAVPSKQPNAIAMRLNILVVAPYCGPGAQSLRLASVVKSVRGFPGERSSWRIHPERGQLARAGKRWTRPFHQTVRQAPLLRFPFRSRDQPRRAAKGRSDAFAPCFRNGRSGRIPSVIDTEPERPLRVDFARSPSRQGKPAFCAQRTAGVDVNVPLRIATANVASGQADLVYAGEHCLARLPVD